MSKSFEVQLSRDPEQVISDAKAAASQNGVRFEGDSQTGSFTGHGIEGSYLILDDRLSINISKKPFIMPWSMIESTLNNFFASAE